ncbi:MAG TPA: Holliday junction branch migration protein RuvA [Bacteroidota bacterium]
MISHLEGLLVEKSPTEIVLSVNGVGYTVHIPLSTYEQLGDAGSKAKVLTHLHLREDAITLYGFATEDERRTFRLLISVNGVGPKMAQGILSGMSVKELRSCLASGKHEVLMGLPGVGRKTAERLIIELRDKLGKPETPSATSTVAGEQHRDRFEALSALLSLGYTRAAAERAIRMVLNETNGVDLSLEDIIKRALRHVGK